MAGATTSRGYGRAHQLLREQWKATVAAGGVICPRCQQPIRRGQPWDLGHVPGSGKRLYAGPEHSRCNRSTANERGAADPAPTPRTKW